MNSLKRIASIATAALTLLAGGIALAPSASATTYQHCSSADGGYLCGFYNTDTGEWRASFLNQSTTKTKFIQFRLVCSTELINAAGYYSSYPGRVISYTWPSNSGPNCSVRMYDAGTRQWYYA